MDFEAVLKLLLEDFQKKRIDFALIGGFALASSGYTRTTKDIDFLVAEGDMPKVKQLMLSYGYELLYESKDVSNFLGKMKELGRVDFLHAHRKYTKSMLVKAKDKGILNGKFKIKVITPEDLIGLKIQSSSNDPNRYHQDMADVESLMRINYRNLDLKLVKEYFELFNRGQEFKEILEKMNEAE